MYLNREPADKYEEVSHDESPVNVSMLFRLHVHNALEIAKRNCDRLIEQDKPKESEVTFWCDMVDDLKQIEMDIDLVSEKEV